MSWVAAAASWGGGWVGGWAGCADCFRGGRQAAGGLVEAGRLWSMASDVSGSRQRADTGRPVAVGDRAGGACWTAAVSNGGRVMAGGKPMDLGGRQGAPPAGPSTKSMPVLTENATRMVFCRLENYVAV